MAGGCTSHELEPGASTGRSGPDRRADAGIEEPDAELGGETACWAHLVCPVCGRMATTARPDSCEFCGADLPD